MNKENKKYIEVYNHIRSRVNLSNGFIPTIRTTSEALNMSLEDVAECYDLVSQYGEIEATSEYLWQITPLFNYTNEQRTRLEKLSRMGY